MRDASPCSSVGRLRASGARCAPLRSSAAPRRRWSRATAIRSPIATARRLPRDTAEVTIGSLCTAEVSAVIHEKLERVARAAQLSARERTVLDLLLLGHRNDEIAEELEISTRTAKFHQANILKKLGLDSRAHLIRLLV